MKHSKCYGVVVITLLCINVAMGVSLAAQENNARLKLSLLQMAQDENNRPQALYYLGLSYYHEFVDNKAAGQVSNSLNLDKAAFYFREASKLGLSDANYAMAELHFSGLGRFTQSQEAGINWLQSAIRMQNTDAMLALGTRLMLGEGVHKDLLLGSSIISSADVLAHPLGKKYLAWSESKLFDNRSDDANWIRKQLPTNYTIEISSAYEEEDARAILLSQSDDVGVLYRTITDEWRTIVGSYSSRYFAEIALKEKFGEISSTLYIRPFIEIQNELLPSNPILGTDWLMQRNPNAFTALIFESDRESKAHDFVVFHGLQNSAIIPSKDEKYKVIAGVFQTLAQAQDVVNNLPDFLQARDVEIVNFVSLQQAAVLTKTLVLPYKTQDIRSKQWLTKQTHMLTQAVASKKPLEASSKWAFGEKNASPEVSIAPVNVAPVNVQNFAYQFPVFNRVSGDQWLKQQNQEHFTVEIFRGDTYHQAVDMMHFIGLEQGAIVELFDGSFVLTSGIFVEPFQAQEAATGLLKEIQDIKPKVHQLKTLASNTVPEKIVEIEKVSIPEQVEMPLPPIKQFAVIATKSGQLRLRQTSDRTSKIIGFVNKGARVEVLAEKEKRTKIALSNGKVGWVPKRYLKSVK